MIFAEDKVKIKRYLMIDRVGEGFGFTEPGEGEELIGIPLIISQSVPYIIHIKNGKVVRTVNTLDVSIIDFE